MNLATYVSMAVCLVGALFAAAVMAVASSPTLPGIRWFSAACFCGALYAASNATLSSGSFEVSRVGIRLGLVWVGLHCASWFVYSARRERRRLHRYEQGIVGVSVVIALVCLVPNVFYQSDERWLHGVPELGIRYIDARSTHLGDLAIAFFGGSILILVARLVRRWPQATGVEHAELVGLALVSVCGANDALATADVIAMPYLLDLGFLALVLAVGAALTRRFVDDAKQLATAQEALVQRERLAALGEMSAVVAHEVRNPVAVIFNAAATMRKHPREREAMLGIVEEEAGRLKQMVSDLLDFTRPITVRLVEEPLAPIIESSLEAVRQASASPAADLEDIAVEYEPGPVPMLSCDVRLVRQALVNLVSNAVQAPERHGPVRIAVAQPRESVVRVAVIDDGVGVAADIADRIFRPFFTTRATGTGLGLAVVQRIARAHGGELRHRATPGGGATFELELPLEPRSRGPA